MGLGVGRTSATFRNSDSSEFGGSVEGSLAGVTAAVEFAIGGTPAPGLVIGGGIFSGAAGSDVETNKINVDGQPIAAVKYNRLTFTLEGEVTETGFVEKMEALLHADEQLVHCVDGSDPTGQTANECEGGTHIALEKFSVAERLEIFRGRSAK
jgi:hypothetical protein